MGDLIDRQAAIDALDQYYKDKKYIARSRTILSAICLDIKATVDSLPSAQPERKKGNWIDGEHDQWMNGVFALRCSECNGGYHLSSEHVIGVWNYCPNCGADMRGGDDEAD